MGVELELDENGLGRTRMAQNSICETRRRTPAVEMADGFSVPIHRRVILWNSPFFDSRTRSRFPKAFFSDRRFLTKGGLPVTKEENRHIFHPRPTGCSATSSQGLASFQTDYFHHLPQGSWAAPLLPFPALVIFYTNIGAGSVDCCDQRWLCAARKEGIGSYTRQTCYCRRRKGIAVQWGFAINYTSRSPNYVDEESLLTSGRASGSSKTIQWGAKHVHSIKFPKLDIKLEQNGEVAFNLWYRTIIDAIESQDCAFLLTGEDMPESYNDNERDKRLAAKKLKLFLMSHLDLHYQGMVGNLSDPKEILSVLRKFCEPTSKAFVNNLMQKFARLDFESQVETPLEFINRFDDLVRKIRQINSDVMNEPYIKQTFMGAIRDTHTYQRELDNEAGFGLSQLKNMLIEEFNEIEQMSVLDKSLRTSTLLATGLNQHQMKGSTLRGRGRGVGVLRRGVQKNLGERSSAANEHFHAKTFRGGVNRKIVCYNCGRKGHPFKMCRSKLRVWYNCNQLTTHLAAQCPEPKRNPGLSYTPSSKAKMTANKKVPKVVKMKVGDAKLFQKHLMKTGKPATTFFIAGEADLKENENTWVLMGENEEISLLNFSRERLGQAAMNVSAGKHLTSFRAVIDTGATEHLANRREYFETLRAFETPKRFTCANKDLEADLVCKYYGDIAILNNGKVSRLKNVLYSPELAVNLFSLRKVTGAGMEVIFSKDKAKFVDSSTEANEKLKNTLLQVGQQGLRFAHNPAAWLWEETRRRILIWPCGSSLRKIILRKVLPLQRIRVGAEGTLVGCVDKEGMTLWGMMTSIYYERISRTASHLKGIQAYLKDISVGSKTSLANLKPSKDVGQRVPKHDFPF
ncbi:unnamed protein product [Nesidiocoris tenuis]|uniref:CCHC-type domain-containing protein n=1 Tax=Nesidiocoris tenuis TaxID=355587 RepID=A0A6H5G601_9HEMI|nr:unnamed protein product [Nesidiocoris tenuis]